MNVISKIEVLKVVTTSSRSRTLRPWQLTKAALGEFHAWSSELALRADWLHVNNRVVDCSSDNLWSSVYDALCESVQTDRVCPGFRIANRIVGGGPSGSLYLRHLVLREKGKLSTFHHYYILYVITQSETLAVSNREYS